MAKQLNIARINELKDNAFDNIESYNDPDTPKALEQFTNQIKGILLADPKMLDSVPEYLPVALYGKVKFPPQAKLKWAHWLDKRIQPQWDEFKVAVAFNNAELPLVVAVKGYSEQLLIESCAVLYLLETQGKAKPAARQPHDDDEEESDFDSDYGSGYDSDYDDDEDSDEEGYYDHYDDEER
jgi:hypothetical protein